MLYSFALMLTAESASSGFFSDMPGSLVEGVDGPGFGPGPGAPLREGAGTGL